MGTREWGKPSSPTLAGNDTCRYVHTLSTLRQTLVLGSREDGKGSIAEHWLEQAMRVQC